jgi:hypothetical protein
MYVTLKITPYQSPTLTVTFFFLSNCFEISSVRFGTQSFFVSEQLLFVERLFHVFVVPNRVAKRFISKPKIPILVYCGRPWYGTFWFTSRQFGIFCSYLVVCGLAITYILLLFGVCSPFFGTLYQRKSGNPDASSVLSQSFMKMR